MPTVSSGGVSVPAARSSARTGRRFTVALTFPGEKRAAVEAIADALAETYGRERVLYDHYHTAEFARPNLDVYLPSLYATDADLIVVFLCPEYASKRWCNLEWRHIRQLLATTAEERIMFVSFGDPGDLTEIGILPGDGWAPIDELSAREAATLIAARVERRPTPPRPRRARWPWYLGLAVAAGGSISTLVASNVVCTTLSRFGHCPGWCESSMTAAEIAGIHGQRLTFDVPPAIANADVQLAPETWLVENNTGRSVGLMYGPLLGSTGKDSMPRSWDLNPNLPPITAKGSRPVELSTGAVQGNGPGEWVIAAFDAANPSRLLAATHARLVFRDAAERSRLVPDGTGALTLDIKSIGEGSYDIVQIPELPPTPPRIPPP